MRYRTITLAAIAYVVMFTVLMVGLGITATRAHASSANPCAEDNPCWAWSTMGDRHRGIVDAWGNPRVVGPCEFVYRKRHGMLSPGLDHMRGDRFARRACGGAFPDTLREARMRDHGEGSF